MSRREFFNEIANKWDEHYETPVLKKALKQLVPVFGLSAGQKVLDAGTGTGILIPYLLCAVGPAGNVTAVDYAEKMVAVCKSKFSHLPNVAVQVQNVEKLKFPAESFDAVICFGLFPHIEKKEALRQIHRVLKTEGRLIIAHALGSEGIKAHHKDAASAVAQDVLPQEATMKQMLGEAGFAGIAIIDEPGCYLCTSKKSPKK